MLKVNGIDVQVVRKKIKNMHLSVCPPDGHVRVSAPDHITDDNIRLAVISRLGWIKQQQKSFQQQARQSDREYISGERHYFLGRAYRLKLIEQAGKQSVVPGKSAELNMFVRPGTSVASKAKLMDSFYRQELKKIVPELLSQWEPVVGDSPEFWGIKKMKTKWGSCHSVTKRIWLNLELAKKPVSCIEYILVHELVHLLEPSHNAHFAALLGQFLPNWTSRRDELNALPVKHESWHY